MFKWRRAYWGAAGVAALVAACSSFSGSDTGNADGGGGDAQAALPDGAAPGADGAVAHDDAAMGQGDAGTDGASVSRKRRVFVTHNPTAATFGSIQPAKDAADQLCAQAAKSIADAGAFLAWVSDGVTPASPAAPGPYYDVTGSVLVFSAAGAFDSSGLRDELGQAPLASWWTGMATTTSVGDTCRSWTGEGGLAVVGKASSWFGGDGAAESPCMGGYSAILCFEQ